MTQELLGGELTAVNDFNQLLRLFTNIKDIVVISIPSSDQTDI